MEDNETENLRKETYVENNAMKSVIETIHKRHSVRNYSGRAIEKEKVHQLSQYLESNKKGPLGSNVLFRLVDGSAYNKKELKELGTYGLIHGSPRLFIAGAVDGNRYGLEDYGYCMEKNVLLATGLGLGTCWMGGTLNRSAFALKLLPPHNWIIPAVTPIGYAEDKKTFKGNAVSFLAGAKKRKCSNELFSDWNINAPLDLNGCGEFAIVLDCVRWAPSAGNLQPWRILKRDKTFHFFIKENNTYNNDSFLRHLIPGVGRKLQNVDMGIAMAHFELAANELGLRGSWQISEPVLDKGNFKYIASWGENSL